MRTFITFLMIMSALSLFGQKFAEDDSLELWLEVLLPGGTGLVSDLFQSNKLSDQQEITIKIRNDRLEIFNPGEIKWLEEAGFIPMENALGVIFTQKYFVYFPHTQEIFAVLRGWDEGGNCHLFAVNLLDRRRTNSCAGAPCNSCNFVVSAQGGPITGCSCNQTAGHCNHTVTQ